MSPSPRRSPAPRVESLEARDLPATFTVLNLNDSGSGSLRQAVLDANDNPGADVIRFRGGLSGTVALTSGQLGLTDDVTVQGPGAGRLAVSGSDASRVFHVPEGVAAAISGLTITRGRADGQAPAVASTGGGILNQGALTLSGVVLSNNKAVGDPTVTVPVNAVFNSVGGAFGGGVGNYGTLSVTRSTFTGNQAVGADEADSSGFSFPGPAFPGNALGAGLANYATANVSGSRFTNNTARAGSNCTGDFAGIGGGGAVLNDASMTITGCLFQSNQALAGDNNVSPFHNGHALGGSIMTGTLLAVIGQGSATITVSASQFHHNQAIGGNDNRVTLPPDQVPPADAPNNGYGGAILVYQGSSTISQSVLTHNRAVGGSGGAEQKGSLGVGGAVFFFNFVGGVTGNVSGGVIAHNEAIGGSGSAGGRGGDGLGGGLAMGGLGAPFSAPGTVTVSTTVVAGNLARGGKGGPGGDGGDGLGGGLFNDADSTLTLNASLVVANRAWGGAGGAGGSAGEGVGGGLYNLGVYSDVLALILGNDASTSDDNVFG